MKVLSEEKEGKIEFCQIDTEMYLGAEGIQGQSTLFFKAMVAQGTHKWSFSLRLCLSPL